MIKSGRMLVCAASVNLTEFNYYAHVVYLTLNKRIVQNEMHVELSQCIRR